MKRLFWAIAMSLALNAGCTLDTRGTGEPMPPEASADRVQELEAAPEVDASVDQAAPPEDAGQESGEDVAQETADVGPDVGDAFEEITDSADAPEESPLPDAVEELAPDVVEEPPPTGTCGPIPQIGWWICYHFPHPLDAGANFVGLAGAVVPPGGDIVYLWADPLAPQPGVKCVAPQAQDNFVKCDLGLLQPKAEVVFAPGLHSNPNDSTQKYLCSEICEGTVEIYHNGGLTGWLVSGSTGGILSYQQHYQPPQRNDLYLKTP